MAVEFEIMQHARMTLARSPPEGLGRAFAGSSREQGELRWDADDRDALMSVC